MSRGKFEKWVGEQDWSKVATMQTLNFGSTIHSPWSGHVNRGVAFLNGEPVWLLSSAKAGDPGYVEEMVPVPGSEDRWFPNIQHDPETGGMLTRRREGKVVIYGMDEDGELIPAVPEKKE